MLDSAATKLGRLTGRAFADLKRRAKETMTARHAYEVVHRYAGRGQLTVLSAVLVF
jgi:hypothetical protein